MSANNVVFLDQREPVTIPLGVDADIELRVTAEDSMLALRIPDGASTLLAEDVGEDSFSGSLSRRARRGR